MRAIADTSTVLSVVAATYSAAPFARRSQLHCMLGEQLNKSVEWRRVQGTIKDHVESFYMNKPDLESPWLTKTYGKRSTMVDESLDEVRVCE